MNQLHMAHSPLETPMGLTIMGAVGEAGQGGAQRDLWGQTVSQICQIPNAGRG